MDEWRRTNDRRHKMTRAPATSDSDSGDDGRGRRPMRRSLSESGSSPMCAACGHEHAPGTTCETCGHHRRPARDPGGLKGGESTSKDSGNGGPPIRNGPTRCEPIVEVIDKFLCIGAFEHTSRDEALLACGIRTVMNVRAIDARSERRFDAWFVNARIDFFSKRRGLARAFVRVRTRSTSFGRDRSSFGRFRGACFFNSLALGERVVVAGAAWKRD